MTQVSDTLKEMYNYMHTEGINLSAQARCEVCHQIVTGTVRIAQDGKRLSRFFDFTRDCKGCNEMKKQFNEAFDALEDPFGWTGEKLDSRGLSRL